MNRNVLIIGNSNYYNLKKIKSCVFDANIIEKDFELLCFHKIKMITDVNFNDMKKAIDDFSSKYECDSLNVIYFSGHGFNCNVQDYITGTDSAINNYVIINAISLKYIIERNNSAHAYVVLILDACRDFKNKSQKPFVEIEIQKDVLIAYATQIGKEAYGTNKRNLSPFTKAIHNNILKSNLSFNNLFQYLRGQLDNDKYVQMSCEISTLTQTIPLTCEYIDSTDEEIYSFLMDKNNGTYMEAMMKAIDFFNKSFLDILYSFAKVNYKSGYKKYPLPLLFEEQQKTFDFKNLPEQLHIEYKDYRWFYKEKEIRIGDLPTLPHSMAYQKPITPINVKLKISATQDNERIKIIFDTNLPCGFILLVRFPLKETHSEYITINNKKLYMRSIKIE